MDGAQQSQIAQCDYEGLGIAFLFKECPPGGKVKERMANRTQTTTALNLTTIGTSKNP